MEKITQDKMMLCLQQFIRYRLKQLNITSYCVSLQVLKDFTLLKPKQTQLHFHSYH